MMWFLMLGIVALMAGALGILSSTIAALFEKKRRLWLGTNAEKNLFQLLLQNAFLALTYPSPSRARSQAFFFQDLRLRSWRANLLWSCWGSFALWLPLLVVLSLFRVNGLMALGAGGAALLVAAFVPRFRQAVVLILAWGAFLILLENGIRLGGGLLMGDGMSLLSFLVDGRPTAVLSLFLVALVIAALTRFQFLFFSLAVLLLSAGWISLSGAVLLWLGERVGLALGFWLRERKARTGPRRLATLSLQASLGGGLMGVLLVGFARDLLAVVPAFGSAGPFESLQAFVALSVLAEFPILGVASVLGHFTAKTAPDDLFEKTFSKPDFANLDAEVVRSALKGIEMRLQKLGSIRGELNGEDWEKIPPGIRSASEEEAKDLEKTASVLRAHLLSRSSGFQNPLQ